jgi:hypothetical protein
MAVDVNPMALHFRRIGSGLDMASIEAGTNSYFVILRFIKPLDNIEYVVYHSKCHDVRTFADGVSTEEYLVAKIREGHA